MKDSERIEQMEKRLEYVFSDKQLLVNALMHSSYTNEIKASKLKCNERLEFLGDSVLGLIIGEYLFSNYPLLEEGRLTKMRSKIVCEASLASCATDMELGRYMLLGRGEERTGGRQRASVLSDAFEALVAAVYLDGGMDAARHMILKWLSPTVEAAFKGRLLVDYKTHLQERAQLVRGSRLRYVLADEQGPDHAKVFFSHVLLNDVIIGRGEGQSKKESEQAAAREALLWYQKQKK